MDPEALTKQIAKCGPEGLRFLMNFLSRQCQKFQSVLKSLYEISHEIELDGAAKKLFDIVMQVTNSKYGTLYQISQNKIQVFISNWPEPRITLQESELFGSSALLKGDMVNTMNFRTSDLLSETLTKSYQSADPDCIISAPFFGDGMRVSGVLELIGKTSGNPLFNSEDEFLVRALSSLSTILFNQISIKQTAAKKSDEIKTFLKTTNAMPSDLNMQGILF